MLTFSIPGRCLARVAPQSSVTSTSLLNVNLWTLQLLVAHYYRQGDFWVVKRLMSLFGPFPNQKEPGKAIPF
jgi:hypothetical protein